MERLKFNERGVRLPVHRELRPATTVTRRAGQSQEQVALFSP
jgi:hypothetical protein